ncbi:MAG: M64 family metallopeptidase [Nanoarchaeota archaeon]|nr:M64 family metallopeptidase [Nanoarchaeota archaeon]
MEKVGYIVIILVLIAFIISGGAFFYIKDNIKLSDAGLVGCNTIQKNSENGVDIVFFADNAETAKEYSDYFLSVSPFDKYKDRFNFYYIGDYYPLCELYKNIALLCYTRDLVKKASSCPNDYIIVINDEENDDIRSSSYMNVMSINAKHPLSVIIHEFGHAFVNLAEEYVPAKIPRNSAGNCVADCNEFGGRNDGCYNGCSLAEYSRSVENGIMRTLRSDNYGSYNEKVVIDKIEKSSSSGGITGKAVGDLRDCEDQKYYSIELKIKDEDGGLSISDRDARAGCIGESGSGDYSFGYVTDDGESFDLGEFNPLDVYTDLPGEVEMIDGTNGEIMMSGETYDNIEPFYGDGPKEDDEEGGFVGEIEYINHLPILIKAELPEDLGIEEVKRFEIRKNGIPIDYIDLCEEVGKGDVNGDGNIDFEGDIVELKEYFDFGIPLACEENADLNSDGIIDEEKDFALLVLRVSSTQSETEEEVSTPISSVSASPSSSNSPFVTPTPFGSHTASPVSSASVSPSGIPTASSSLKPSASSTPLSSDNSPWYRRITGWMSKWFD